MPKRTGERNNGRRVLAVVDAVPSYQQPSLLQNGLLDPVAILPCCSQFSDPKKLLQHLRPPLDPDVVTMKSDRLATSRTCHSSRSASVMASDGGGNPSSAVSSMTSSCRARCAWSLVRQ